MSTNGQLALRTRVGANRGVKDVALSARLIARLGHDMFVEVLNRELGLLYTRFIPSAFTIAIASHADVVALGTIHGFFYLWDLRTGCIAKHRMGQKGEVRVGLSSDGARCVAVFNAHTTPPPRHYQVDGKDFVELGAASKARQSTWVELVDGREAASGVVEGETEDVVLGESEAWIHATIFDSDGHPSRFDVLRIARGSSTAERVHEVDARADRSHQDILALAPTGTILVSSDSTHFLRSANGARTELEQFWGHEPVRFTDDGRHLVTKVERAFAKWDCAMAGVVARVECGRSQGACGVAPSGDLLFVTLPGEKDIADHIVDFAGLDRSFGDYLFASGTIKFDPKTNTFVAAARRPRPSRTSFKLDLEEDEADVDPALAAMVKTEPDDRQRFIVTKNQEPLWSVDLPDGFNSSSHNPINAMLLRADGGSAIVMLFPWLLRVERRGEGGIIALEVLMLGSSQYLARRERRWFATPDAFSHGVITLDGHALTSSLDATARLGPPAKNMRALLAAK